jgi:hypothetical protein
MKMLFEAISSMFVMSGDQTMSQPVKNPFTAHPHALDETYTQHFGHALRYSGLLLAASLCALVHAVLPFMFEKTASNMIKKMHGDMMVRGAVQSTQPRHVEEASGYQI